MTREDVLRMFPEATDEQITNLLNQNNSEVAKEKNKANQYKEKALLADSLQTKIDELEGGKLDENERLKKDLEKYQKQVAELTRKNTIRDLRETVMSNLKVTAEQAKEIVKDDGNFDTAFLGQVISEKETASAIAKEQEIANNAGNPGGGNGGSGEISKGAEMAQRYNQNNIVTV